MPEDGSIESAGWQTFAYFAGPSASLQPPLANAGPPNTNVQLRPRVDITATIGRVAQGIAHGASQPVRGGGASECITNCHVYTTAFESLIWQIDAWQWNHHYLLSTLSIII